MSIAKSEFIFSELEKMFPNASCELHYANLYQLLIAVVLSSQTTDKRVNIVTGPLFLRYPTIYDLASAKKEDVMSLISSLGLFHNKAKNIILLSQKVVDEYDGIIPDTLDELVKLPGVGRKTANVVLGEWYKVPAIAVDTHVARVSKRLGLTTNDDVIIIEHDLQSIYPEEKWVYVHHLFIHFGRYFCFARNPRCNECPFIKICQYQTKKAPQ